MPLVGEVPTPPPARRTRTSAASDKTKLGNQKPETPSRAAERANTLMEFAGIGQGIALMTGNYADAETIEMHAGPLLTAVAKLGDIHPQFGESIDKTKEISPYFAVFAAAIPMVTQFMANHGRIDPARIRFGGIQNPQVLADRQRSKVAQAQAEMIREQREAAEQAARAQQTLNEEIAAYNSLAETLNGVPQGV